MEAFLLLASFFVDPPPCSVLGFVSSHWRLFFVSLYLYWFDSAPALVSSGEKKLICGGEPWCRCQWRITHRSGWGENEQLLRWSCVYHSEAEQVSSAPVDTGRRVGLSNRPRRYWSHRWSPKAPGAMEWRRGGTSIPADRGLCSLCVVCANHNNNAPEPMHVAWGWVPNRARERKNISVMTAACRWEWSESSDIIYWVLAQSGVSSSTFSHIILP